MSAPERDLRWTLNNIYTIARRRAHPRLHDAWSDVLRLCEEAGCAVRGVLRDAEPSADPNWFQRQAARVEADRAALPEWLQEPERQVQHTCIKDDGGTPGRACAACKAERDALLVERDNAISKRDEAYASIEAALDSNHATRVLKFRISQLNDELAALRAELDALKRERLL